MLMLGCWCHGCGWWFISFVGGTNQLTKNNIQNYAWTAFSSVRLVGGHSLIVDRSIQHQNGQMAVSTGDSSVQCQVSSASDAVTDDADCG
jgi:major membrane immunogen (membrane-anchored lipoprotein)